MGTALFLAVTGVAIDGWERQARQYVERVDVARVLVDVRVLDREGAPMTDLAPDDFTVKIDGRAARVDSVAWVGSVAPRSSETAAGGESGPATASSRSGRLIV